MRAKCSARSRCRSCRRRCRDAGRAGAHRRASALSAHPLANMRATTVQPGMDRRARRCAGAGAARDVGRKTSHGSPGFCRWRRASCSRIHADHHHGEEAVALRQDRAAPTSMTMLIEAQPDIYSWPEYYGASGWLAIKLNRRDVDWDQVVGELALRSRSWELAAPRRLAGSWRAMSESDLKPAAAAGSALARLIALAALIVSALGVWIAWKSSDEDKPTEVVEQRSAQSRSRCAAPPTVTGATLTICPADPEPRARVAARDDQGRLADRGRQRRTSSAPATSKPRSRAARKKPRTSPTACRSASTPATSKRAPTAAAAAPTRCATNGRAAACSAAARSASSDSAARPTLDSAARNCRGARSARLDRGRRRGDPIVRALLRPHREPASRLAWIIVDPRAADRRHRRLSAARRDPDQPQAPSARPRDRHQLPRPAGDDDCRRADRCGRPLPRRSRLPAPSTASIRPAATARTLPPTAISRSTRWSPTSTPRASTVHCCFYIWLADNNG